MLINVYAPNTGAPHVKERLLDLKGELDCDTLIDGDLNTPLFPLDRPSRQKIGKEIKDLNGTINQNVLTDIYRAFHPTTTKYTLFLPSHRTFSKIDHIVGHKANYRFKGIETISSIFSDHDGIKLEFNFKRNAQNT